MNEQQSFAYEQAIERLVHCVPELSDTYQRELEWWGTERPGPHVIYDEILNPYINALLASDVADADRRLKNVFDFIERLSVAADDRLQDLVAVTICEPLMNDPLRMDRARSHMGPATRRILQRAQRN